MKRSLLSLASAICISALGLVPISGAQEGAPPPPAPPRTLSESLEQAYKLINTKQFPQAKAELERASALAAGPCGECLLGMSHVYEWEKKWDQAVDAAQRALPLLGTPALKARAYDQLGMVYMVLPGSLGKAEDALRQGAELGGGWGGLARYHLVEVLMMQKHWAQALEEARRYVKDADPATTYAKQAHVFICWSRDKLPVDSPPPGEPDQPAVRVGEGGIARPEILVRRNPVVPAGTRGAATVDATIDEEGCVRDVKTLKAPAEELGKAAEDALRQWVFSASTVDGKPMKTHYVLTVNFN